ncbi:hypothetical protein [Colwellia sp. Bg11-28]|uniref:hypothetical protein n=1 Tax=Colwellia sp. Bg11-28 TaxID=2058305 RepID=UPI000C31DF1B|nr:hypothetical protein [Colwellia sp. Bg11-28]PKH87728.1 hypothetical protein CXF79_13910 [Colwellia sp. Bg11-28]
MDLAYWIDFIVVFALGVMLVQISHGKFLDTAKFNLNLSPSFLKIIRYMGLFIIVYSGYGVIIDYAVTH